MALIELSRLEEAVEGARRREIDRDAEELLRWAHGLLGNQVMMTTSFQKGGMVLLHMVRECVPSLPVFFIDTGRHFPETLEFADRIRRDWGINLIIERSPARDRFFSDPDGNLCETDPDLCCHLNKVVPSRQIVGRHQGWITAIRRYQASTRVHADTLEILDGGKLKVQPLAFWTRERVNAYLLEHEVPIHPLHLKGYPSIGCAPCTRPCFDPANERAGRWAGQKIECGLHTFSRGRAGAPAKRPAC